MSRAKYIIKYRLGIFIIVALLSTFATIGIKDLQVTVNIEDFFVKGDSAITNQEHFRQLFGQNDFMAVLVESDDVFSINTLEKIKEISDSIESKIPYIDNTVSIINLPTRTSYHFDNKGNITNTTIEIDSITQLIKDDPALTGLLFGKGGYETIISSTLSLPKDDSAPTEFDLGELIYTTIQDIKPSAGVNITAVAPSVFAFRKKQEMMHDLVKVLIFGGIIAAFLCLLIFKSVQSFIGTIVLITLTPCIVFGLLGWFGISVDSTFISVPILLTMGISIGNAVHVNHFFRIDVEFHGDRKKAVLYAINHSWRPILFTAITTISALLSFIFVKVNTIKWVGITSATCVLVMYILCMLLFPIILSWGKQQIKASPKRSRYESWFVNFSLFTLRRKNIITILFIIFTLIGILGSRLITIDFNSTDMMGAKLPHMKTQLLIKKSKICSNEFIDLTIVANKNDFRDDQQIHQLQLLQDEINQLPLIKRTTSVIQLLQQSHMALNGGLSEYYKTPETKAKIYKSYYNVRKHAPHFADKWITKDYSTTRIFIELTDFSSKIIKSDMDEIDHLVQKYFPEKKESFLSGATYQMAIMNQYMTQGLINSVGIALIMITLLMMICFKSIKLGLIAMFPNVFPVIICGAVVGLSNIPLEFVTMTVAPLILGLAVDDTIHFISSLKKNIRMHNDYLKGIKASYKEVGLAISKTTLILSATFMAFTISDVNSIKNMGILSCVGIIAAYIADIFIVPILINWIKPFTLDPERKRKSQSV